MLHGLIGRLAGMLTVLVVAALVCAPSAAAMSAAAAATAMPGIYEFLARGFRPHEPLSTWLTGPDGRVIATDNIGADRNGVAFYVFRIPRHYQAGPWAMTAHGRHTGREAIATFEVIALGPNIPLLPTPAAGSPGTTFAFTGGPLGPDEVGSTWATGPDGQTYPGDYVSADAAGRVDFAFTVPADGPRGVWTITVYGPQSDQMGQATITVT